MSRHENGFTLLATPSRESSISERLENTRASLGDFDCFFYAASSFLISLILARYLGVEQFGIYSSAIAWLSILSSLSVLGFDQILVREISVFFKKKRFDLFKGIRRFSIKLVFITAIMSLCMGIALSTNFYNSFEVIYSIGIALFILPITGISKLNQSTVRGLGYIELGQIAEYIIRPLVFLILIVISGYFLSHIESNDALILRLVASFVALICSYLILRYTYSKESIVLNNTSYKRKIWLFSSFSLFLVSGMNVVIQQIDVIMMGILSSTSNAGIISVVNRGGELANFFYAAVSISFAPKIAELYNANELKKLKEKTRKLITITALSTVIVGIVLIIFGDFFLGLFGQKFIPGYLALVIIVVCYIIISFLGPITIFLTMTNNEKVLAYSLFISVIVNLVLNYLLIPEYELNGAAIATGISTLLYNVIGFIYLKSKKLI